MREKLNVTDFDIVGVDTGDGQVVNPEHVRTTVDRHHSNGGAIRPQKFVTWSEFPRIDPASFIVDPERVTIGRSDVLTVELDVNQVLQAVADNRLVTRRGPASPL